jgi:hypothetical protein
MMSIEKIEEMPCVWVYKNYFEVKDFIEKFEEETQKSWPYIDWNRSRIGGNSGNTESEYRSSLEAPIGNLLNDDLVDDIAELGEQYKNIFSSIDKCIWDYRNSYDLHLNNVEGMSLLKYQNNAQYHAHYDHSPENSRVLSLVACLGEEFEGGELEFPYFNKTIKLEKNSLVLFPSNFPYTHIAHPVTDGVKYSLVMWFI